MKKRCLALMLAILLFVGILPLPVMAEGEAAPAEAVHVHDDHAHDDHDHEEVERAAALAEDALESGTVFVILTRWDAASKALLGSLTGRGSQIVPVLVAPHVPDEELPDGLRVVTPESVLTGGDLPV